LNCYLKSFVKPLNWTQFLINFSENNTIQAQIKFTNFDSKPDSLKYVVQKSDHSTLYITRDIAALFDRIKRLNLSKIVYVVGEYSQSNSQTNVIFSFF
jgi:arginyl-tRNA synthetase